MKNPTALIIIFAGVEELEAVAPIDCLRRAGTGVTVAALSANLHVEGRNGIKLCADKTLDSCLENDYDMVIIPGGPGHALLMDDSRVLNLLNRQNSAGNWIASICAGPLVLEKAGLLDGKRFTSFPATAEKLPDRDAVQRVVRDGNIITSQGAGTAIDFGLSLVAALFDEAKSREIAAEICH